MREARLRQALESVREYFSGKELSDNTVLAAYLRSRGLPASGQPWEIAKRAMSRGADFEEAVLQAATNRSSLGQFAEVSPNEKPTPFVGSSLEWFPKQFGPGDIDGVGAKRLLGTPDLDPHWVLVRETAQNSWDARGTSPSIDFTLNLRRLPESVVEVLRTRIFTGRASQTGLPGLLSRDEVWALEVVDRGTVGLGGPIRNDLAVDPGEDTNFIDLVFNIGAPRDVHLGGGTYGFGKTIAYVVSGVGTVLIWSRCEGGRGAEHRLIGSAISDGFNMDGRRYTGRHWWGNSFPEDGRVEPVVGTLAQELGNQVFARDFDQGETGTSILILDPDLGGDSPEEGVERLTEAVVWNLWPKLLSDQTGHSRMNIEIQLNGEAIPLPQVEKHTVLSGYAASLSAVRAAQSGHESDTAPAGYPVDVREIWCNRPRLLLGHLALTRFPVHSGVTEPAHSVTLMRHQAELVVRYLDGPVLDVDGFQWAGVFKPVPDVDDSFAMAEPPAHDDWVAKAVQDKPRRRHVTVALRRIKEAIDEYLSPRDVTLSDAEPATSAAHIGDMLADLLQGLEGPAPTTRTGGSRGGAPRPPRPSVDVVDVTHEPAVRPGWTRTTLSLQLTNAQQAALIDVSVRVGVDGGSMDDSEVVTVLGWESAIGEPPHLGAQRLRPGAVARFVYEAHSELAIDVQTKLAED